ncbi:MAG: hypothetical protein BCS36_11405 [Desulfovibrio sp. MES5]|uniref:hypothetical protein n=1 Tax=Desulfovibrio sp. MES5 TaxID=1899016 RepID=UPI000B9D491D|nr:hypothetical protein [Desulfovibrio sp. MES5]OXS27649.1 MAG: hypothetical protein BCS36_11405 [Desulfovibrio sp. MES5]
MTLEGVDASARAFIRGAWPLCLIAMLNVLVMAAICEPYMLFSSLYGLAGCLIFIRGFGLATSWPIYCLAVATFFTATPTLNEIAQIQSMLHLEHMDRSYLWDLVTAFKSALMALPFSLFFFDRMGGYAALVKIPLCVFFLVLVLEPTIFTLLLFIFGM